MSAAAGPRQFRGQPSANLLLTARRLRWVAGGAGNAANRPRVPDDLERNAGQHHFSTASTDLAIGLTVFWRLPSWLRSCHRSGRRY